MTRPLLRVPGQELSAESGASAYAWDRLQEGTGEANTNQLYMEMS